MLLYILQLASLYTSHPATVRALQVKPAYLPEAAFSKFIMVLHETPHRLSSVSLVINIGAEHLGILLALGMQIEVEQPVLLPTLQFLDEDNSARAAKTSLPQIGHQTSKDTGIACHHIIAKISPLFCACLHNVHNDLACASVV
jgi:hypothetical protein